MKARDARGWVRARLERERAERRRSIVEFWSV